MFQKVTERPINFRVTGAQLGLEKGNDVPDAGMVQRTQILSQSNLTAASLGGHTDSSIAIKAIVENFTII